MYLNEEKLQQLSFQRLQVFHRREIRSLKNLMNIASKKRMAKRVITCEWL